MRGQPSALVCKASLCMVAKGAYGVLQDHFTTFFFCLLYILSCFFVLQSAC